MSAFARTAVLAILRQHGLSKLETAAQQNPPPPTRHLEPHRGGARR
jgi:hypothetical protein